LRVCSTPCLSAAGTGISSFSIDGPSHDSALNDESDMLLGLLDQLNESVNTPDIKTTLKNISVIPTQPQVVGLSSKELESLNELIKFDHEYHKAPSSVVQKTTSSQAKPVAISIPELSVEDVSLLDNIVSDNALESLLNEFSRCQQGGPVNSSLVQKTVSVPDHSVSQKMDNSHLSVSNTIVDYCSDSGISDGTSYSDVPSPSSVCSSGLNEDIWEESFTELFPTLI